MECVIRTFYPDISPETREKIARIAAKNQAALDALGPGPFPELSTGECSVNVADQIIPGEIMEENGQFGRCLVVESSQHIRPDRYNGSGETGAGSAALEVIALAVRQSAVDENEDQLLPHVVEVTHLKISH